MAPWCQIWVPGPGCPVVHPGECNTKMGSFTTWSPSHNSHCHKLSHWHRYATSPGGSGALKPWKCNRGWEVWRPAKEHNNFSCDGCRAPVVHPTMARCYKFGFTTTTQRVYLLFQWRYKNHQRTSIWSIVFLCKVMASCLFLFTCPYNFFSLLPN